MMIGCFDLPNIEYFISNNSYIGSDRRFQYKLSPVKTDELQELHAYVWYGMNCMEKSEIAAVKTFALVESGLLEAVAWLEEQKNRNGHT